MEQLGITGRSRHDTPDEFATLSAVIIDGEEVFIDNGAIHGKSRVERGISFSAKSPDEVPGGIRIPVIWVTLRRTEGGFGYSGICGSVLVIDKEARTGYKSLPDQVNKMDAAMKGKVQVDALTEKEKKLLSDFLREFRGGELWKNTDENVKSSLS
ncbi:hypothetical protein DNHGIG_03740 [Collibacillus ludicampi]|uniref:Uncharacterized protein n=1 Tax=Collibacillus ludicampi TaxID=2771369 RepID=A0AAV4LAL9_9BACL|nr:YwhD family protein [Collibacillus ludicampi]GIM44825.1 hypothetical protein DNHGIG_03740 [Collibacillus ludicampi]